MTGISKGGPRCYTFVTLIYFGVVILNILESAKKHLTVTYDPAVLAAMLIRSGRYENSENDNEIIAWRSVGKYS